MNANYVLTYCENTDGGDPTASVTNRFFRSRTAALAALEESVQKSNDILHFLEMKADEEHYVSRTEESCYVVDGCDSMRWEVNPMNVEDNPVAGVPILKVPMTRDAALEAQAKDGGIKVCVMAQMADIEFYSRLGGLTAFFSNAIVERGEECVNGLQYTAADLTDGAISFLITANIDAEAAWAITVDELNEGSSPDDDEDNEESTED